MTAANGAPAHGADLGALAALPGLETITGQIADLIAVLRAEQARRQAGIEIRRPAWKNLVFTGGPGTGKSRAARALAQLYKDLGLLTYGHLIEIAAADLAGATPRDTATQIAEVIKPRGALLLITGAHIWHALPDRGQHLLSCLYQQMTAAHHDHEGHPRELAIILSGRKDPLHALLTASPPLAARFPAIIDFPGYTPAQLAAIVTMLASEAGLCLTPDAQRKAAAALAEAEKRHATGNARLAVRLLNQATTSQGRRVIAASHNLDPAELATICAGDIPVQLPVEDSPQAQQPGHYL
jgi:AAA lid domain/ATPase family associated with various cellular activities (AAA)